jgi:hypothetical protein
VLIVPSKSNAARTRLSCAMGGLEFGKGEAHARAI